MTEVQAEALDASVRATWITLKTCPSSMRAATAYGQIAAIHELYIGPAPIEGLRAAETRSGAIGEAMMALGWLLSLLPKCSQEWESVKSARTLVSKIGR